jgi:DNA repair photolyase
MIGTGAMSDPYIPIPQNLENIRSCLEIIEKYGFGLAIHTKSNLLLRDLPLLKKIHAKAKCVVETTFTTFDEDLCKIIEPNVATTKERFEMLNILRDNGIATVVWLCPILPFINDTKENIQGLLRYCIEAGVRGILSFGMGLTLREGNREYFYKKLDEHFPGLKQVYQKKYGNNYVIASDNEAALMSLLNAACKAHNILCTPDAVFAYLNAFEEKPPPAQLELF